MPAGDSTDDLASRVVILANSRQPDSVELANYYAGRRHIPVGNIVTLPLPDAESITWREFIDQLYQPLQDELFRRGWISGESSNLQDRFGRKRYALAGHRIAYLVVCRGVPLRIVSDPTLLDASSVAQLPPQMAKNEAAVDAELSLLAQSGYVITGYIRNPLFNNDRPSIFETDQVVKVSRLDGPTAESARGLVDSALEGERRGLVGRYYVDLKGPHAEGDRWLEETHQELQGLGFDGDVENTPGIFEASDRFDAPVFYFGWYRSDLSGAPAAENFHFPPGAIALHIQSFSAQTLRSTTAGWCGPLVARGVAATVGNVFEPYLEFTHRPNLLLHALSQGKTFGDAVYYSQPALSWQEVAIGDPLYRPFKVSLEEQEKTRPELPPRLVSYVLVRHANLLVRDGRGEEALTLLIKAGHRSPDLVLGLAAAKLALARNDSAAAMTALAFLPGPHRLDPADWPLEREAARLLAAHGSGLVALQLYSRLAVTRAPTPEARRVLLAEARQVAETEGETQLAGSFARQLAAPIIGASPVEK